MNPLHWLKSGQIKRIRNSPLFDAKWYLNRYRDVAESGMDPAKHYLLYGAADLRDPGPRFSTSGYAAQHGVGDQNPLLHCIANGTSPETSMEGQKPVTGPTLLLVGHQAETQVFGAERSFLHMLDQASITGATVHALLPKIGNTDYMQEVLNRCHKLHVLPFSFRSSQNADDQTVRALRDLIKTINPRALHQNTLAPDAPLIAAKSLGIETVCHIRELPPQDPDLCKALGQSAEALRTQVIEQSDRRVVNSKAVQDWLNDPKAQLLPNSINPRFFDLPFTPHTPLRVGLIGNLVHKKGIEDAVKLASLTTAQIILIGPMTDDLKALGTLPENVHHTGYIADSLHALEHLDIVLSLSHFAESFGRTVYEGMAAGRPVICYDKGTPPTLLGDSLRDLIAKTNHPQAVADILNGLIEAPEKVQHYSTLARARAAELQAQTDEIDLSQIFVT